MQLVPPTSPLADDDVAVLGCELVEELLQLIGCESGVELLVTAKDAVKLRELGVACCSLEVELQITEGAAPLRSLIEAKLCGGSDV